MGSTQKFVVRICDKRYFSEKSDGSSQTAKVLPAPPDSVKPGIANAKPSTVQERKNEPNESVTPSNPSEQPSNNDETSSKPVPTPDVTGTME